MTPEEIAAQKEQSKKDRLGRINLVLSIFENNLVRQTYYKDNVTASCIFLDKLLTIIDIVKGVCLVCNEDVTDDLRNRFYKVMLVLDNNVKMLIDMVQHPCYSPDHPYGKKLMEYVEDDFNDNKTDFTDKV